jgi:hypothetical protein
MGLWLPSLLGPERMTALIVIVLWLLSIGLAVAFTLGSVALFMRGFRKAMGQRHE